MVAFSQFFYWGGVAREGGGIEGEGGERFEDKRTRARGAPVPFLLGKQGGCGRVGVGAVFWKLHTSHLHVPPHHPSRKPGVRLDRVVRPAGTLLSPTLSPQALPCPQRTLTTNDPKTILK